MHAVPVKRKLPILLTVSAAALAAIAAGALGASPASAATPSTATSSTGVTLSISPRSGSNYSTDAATVSWTVPSACVGQEVDAFLYRGTTPWNKKAIDTAEGNNGAQETYFSFSQNPGAAATGSASWPNVSPGYYDFGVSNTVVYPTTALLLADEAGDSAGYYTIAIACVNSTTYQPITNSSGVAIAGSFAVDIGATGDSWKAISGIGTQITMTGSGTAGANGKVSLTAHVAASNGKIPAGGVNFYAGPSVTGTPLNGSTPVPVGSTGKASFSGPSGYPAGDFGAQVYEAEFVPANPAKYTPATVVPFAVIDLIKEHVTLTVTATQDPSSATSVELIAKGTGTPHNLVKEDPGGGVDFIVDGTVVENDPNPPYTPFQFNSKGIASHIISGLKPGTHTFSAVLVDNEENPLNPAVGYVVKVNTVKFTVK